MSQAESPGHAAPGSSWLDAAPRLPAWGALAAPAPELRTVVIVPARDEAERLAAALAALARQRALDGGALPRGGHEVLLLVNNCSDRSAQVARAYADAHPAFALHVVEATLPPALAHIGYVRRELMNEACRRLGRAGRVDAVIASTDADSEVAPTWLAATLAEIDAGADAVGGRILVDVVPPPSAAALRLRRLDAAHALLRCRVASLLDPEPCNPWPHHHQHFGASLAVRAAAYERVGGVPDVEYLEDDALVRVLERADLRVRRSPDVRVTTSARLDGRARVGLSWQLRQWADDGGAADPRVEAPARFVEALQARAALRRGWQRHRAGDAGSGDRFGVAWWLEEETSSLCERIGLGDADLRAALAGAEAFGALWERLDALRMSRLDPARDAVPRSLAIDHLHAWLRGRRAVPRARTTSPARAAGTSAGTPALNPQVDRRACLGR